MILFLSNRAGSIPANSSLGYVYTHEARVTCRCFTIQIPFSCTGESKSSMRQIVILSGNMGT